MIDSKLFKNEEKAIFTLRALYGGYGYLPFKMSKFEEYDLYVRNKDFLVSDRVITFNDTNGKLLALKPDVTLSIIKNTTDSEGCKEKVYYNENVYRVSGSTHQFKEIMQTGLECIGDIDMYDIFEAVYLAAKSLDTVSSDFVLDISHMGVLSAVLDEVCGNEEFKKEIITLIGEKNPHEAAALCDKYGIGAFGKERICAFVNMHGSTKDVISKLEKLCLSDKSKAELDNLKELCALISDTEYADNIKIDFSVLNDMSYYNSIVFKGFIEGIPEGILSGGRYDKLMQKMGRKAGAIGFAVYLDMLERLDRKEKKYDADMVLLYGDDADMRELMRAVELLTGSGKSVIAEKTIPADIRYRQLLSFRNGGLEILETND